MLTVKGTHDIVGKTIHVLVQWEGKKGTMEFWQSYPSFSPLGVKEFTAENLLLLDTEGRVLPKVEVEKVVREWEQGGGLAF